ncbi:SRPBCC family protein [Streptomyces sp. NPDC004111]|uniref:SRPBCC family protein n=1 Tax=Streptomyces sp. NPDC004111 TaxID=3364690 RepID=UPI0036900F3D
MPTEEFTRSVVVARPVEEVFAHLARPESYIGLSPLIVAVREVDVSADAVRYVAVERFRLRALRWDNPIRVTMTFPEPGRRIVSEVWSPGRVRLESTVVLTDDSAKTRVSETVRVTFPGILRALVVGQATKVQGSRLAELARRMDRAPGS